MADVSRISVSPPPAGAGSVLIYTVPGLRVGALDAMRAVYNGAPAGFGAEFVMEVIDKTGITYINIAGGGSSSTVGFPRALVSWSRKCRAFNAIFDATASPKQTTVTIPLGTWPDFYPEGTHYVWRILNADPTDTITNIEITVVEDDAADAAVAPGIDIPPVLFLSAG